MKPYTVGFIFARGGSKGVIRKNTRLLAGQPLVSYAIESALESKFINRVVVSTDDGEIASIARSYGAEVPFMRPKQLAQDDSPEWLAWQHAISTLSEIEKDLTIDLFVSIPATSPLRSVEDIDNAILLYLNSNVDAVITVKQAHRHPSFNMVSFDENETVRLVMPPEKPIYRRQDTTAVFDMTTVAYVVSPSFIMTSNSIFEGDIKAIVIPEERAIDIDNELDFQFAEFLMSERLKD